jgi:TrmH family RNA methyltransferase
LAASSPRIAQLRKLLARRSEREQRQRFVVEGPLLVREALVCGAPVVEILASEEWLSDPDRLDALESGHDPVPVVAVRAGVLERVLDATTPRPVAAIVERTTATLASVTAGRGPVVVLAGVSDPGNAGSLLRSAEAAGAAGVVFTTGSVDPFSPKTVRASAGSVLRVPIAEATLPETLIECRAAGRTVISASQLATADLDHADLTVPVALVLGNESRGVEDVPTDLVDVEVSIPMQGAAESLNVAMAGTVLLFEAARQRRQARTDGRQAGTDGRPATPGA